MSAYTIAWLVISIAALGGAASMYFWLRGLSPIVKSVLIAAVLAFFLLPAPVPGYAGHVAPAFVVAVFELLFQTDGKPGVSLRILAVGLTLIVGAVWAFHHFGLARRGKNQE